MDRTIPVTVIGGYLGSGKTTLVNNLLRHAAGKRLAVMVNEFGDLPIDEDLIEANGDEIISLAGGCVCCSYGSDLIEAMNRLSELNPPPDNVLLETSGVALPGAVAGTMSLLQGFALDGIVVLADAETVQSVAKDKFMRDTIERQLADADLLLLNKIDLVSEQHIKNLRNWLAQYAPSARGIETQRSIISPDVVLQNFIQIDHERSASSTQHDVHFDTQNIDVDDSVDAAEFAQCLISDNPRLVRAKGFVRDANGMNKTIQIVGKRYEVLEAPENASVGMVAIFKRQ